MLEKNIVLVGFMGCGKTTVGRRLAGKLDFEFLDTDIQIQNDIRMSVNDIFAKYGEQYFRKLERNLCKLIAVNTGLIVATGGGIIKSKSNLDSLKVSGTIVYLEASPEKIYGNIKYDTSRPLLNGVFDKLKRIEELLNERKPLYESCADITINTDNNNIEDTVEEIISLTRKGFFNEENQIDKRSEH